MTSQMPADDPGVPEGGNGRSQPTTGHTAPDPATASPYPPAIYTPGMPRSWSESQYDAWTDQVAQELTLQGFEDWCETRAEADYERRYTP